MDPDRRIAEPVAVLIVHEPCQSLPEVEAILRNPTCRVRAAKVRDVELAVAHGRVKALSLLQLGALSDAELALRIEAAALCGPTRTVLMPAVVAQVDDAKTLPDMPLPKVLVSALTAAALEAAAPPLPAGGDLAPPPPGTSLEGGAAAARLGLLQHYWEVVLLLGADGRIVYSSPSAARIVGFTAAELVGYGLEAFLAADSAAEYSTRLAELVRSPGATLTRLFQHRHKDGGWLWLEGHATNLLLDRQVAAIVINYRDVTARRRAEIALRLSEERFRVAVSNARLSVSTCDRELRYTWVVNPRRGQTPEELLGRRDDEVLGPKAGRALVAFKQSVLDTGRAARAEVVLPGDAEEVVLAVTAEPLCDKRGELRGLTVAAQDVSELKRAEAAVREHAELLDLSPTGIIVRDAGGTILSWSGGAERLYGWARDEALGRSCHALLGTSGPERLAALEADLRRDGQWQGQLQQRRRDGSVVWVASRWMLEAPRGHAAARILETNTDITEQRRAEEALLGSEQRLRLAVEGMLLGTWELRLATDELILSERCRALFGLAAAVPVSSADVLARVLDDDRASVRAAFAAAQRPADGGAHLVEFRVRSDAAGGCRWLQSNGLVTVDAAGRPQRIVGTILDISDRKLAEQALNAAKDLAEAANRAKSAFLANMSHEIRTPLGSILGFTELLKQEGVPAKDREKFLETISRNGRHLAQLIDDILDLSKVEAGKLTVERLRVSLVDVVDEVLALHSLAAREKGLELSAQCAPGVPRMIDSDPVRLRQILTNIIGNAVKFTDKGAVTLYVEAQPASPGGEGRIAFRIDDTGRGMGPAEQTRLFQAFSQADDATTRKYGGTGLGLVLSRRLARLLGGEVVLAQSRPGLGSTFLVTIGAGVATAEPEPVSAAPARTAAPAGPAGPRPEPRLDGVTVLLAEDVVENQTLIRHILVRHGATVHIADNGVQAVELALRCRPDVVLMDIQMPLLDGYGATEQLRKLGFARPIVALTAFAMKEERTRCLACGCDDQLTKPISPVSLVHAVDRYARETQPMPDGAAAADRSAAPGPGAPPALRPLPG